MDCHVTDRSYDDTVKFAAKTAEETGGLLVQDTAWTASSYRTIAREALDAMKENSCFG